MFTKQTIEISAIRYKNSANCYKTYEKRSFLLDFYWKRNKVYASIMMWGAAYGGTIMSEMPNKIREMMTEIDEMKETIRKLAGDSGQFGTKNEIKDSKR